MKIRELKAAIKGLDDNMDVLLSSDSEGNHFHDVYGAQVDKVMNYGDELEVMAPEDYDELDDEDKENVTDCLVLWP